MEEEVGREVWRKTPTTRVAERSAGDGRGAEFAGEDSKSQAWYVFCCPVAYVKNWLFSVRKISFSLFLSYSLLILTKLVVTLWTFIRFGWFSQYFHLEYRHVLYLACKTYLPSQSIRILEVLVLWEQANSYLFEFSGSTITVLYYKSEGKWVIKVV